MRLLFLCSSLEPGCDGVGDYARLLAGECERLGHTCALLALNDPHVLAHGGFLNPELGAFRLPSRLAWNNRVQFARRFLERFAPDWVSLQFVPYGLQAKGNVSRLVPGLRTLLEGVPVHLMFHETWVGCGTRSPGRHRVIGYFQRLAAQRLARELAPRVVTTTIPAYVTLLGQAGITASLLPLFGNIPVAPRENLATLGIAEADRSRWQIGVFFGGFSSEWLPQPLLGLLLQAARETGKRLALVLAGRPGAKGEALWRRLEADYANEITFIEFGPMPADQVSSLLQQADFGLATSPWDLIGKSGSVAAMLDHGLPVIVARDDFRLRDGEFFAAPSDPLLHRVDAALPAKLAPGLARRAPHPRLPAVAHDFLRLLEPSRHASPGP